MSQNTVKINGGRTVPLPLKKIARLPLCAFSSRPAALSINNTNQPINRANVDRESNRLIVILLNGAYGAKYKQQLILGHIPRRSRLVEKLSRANIAKLVLSWSVFREELLKAFEGSDIGSKDAELLSAVNRYNNELEQLGYPGWIEIDQLAGYDWSWFNQALNELVWMPDEGNFDHEISRCVVFEEEPLKFQNRHPSPDTCRQPSSAALRDNANITDCIIRDLDLKRDTALCHSETANANAYDENQPQNPETECLGRVHHGDHSYEGHSQADFKFDFTTYPTKKQDMYKAVSNCICDHDSAVRMNANGIEVSSRWYNANMNWPYPHERKYNDGFTRWHNTDLQVLPNTISTSWAIDIRQFTLNTDCCRWDVEKFLPPGPRKCVQYDMTHFFMSAWMTMIMLDDFENQNRKYQLIGQPADDWLTTHDMNDYHAFRNADAEFNRIILPFTYLTEASFRVMRLLHMGMSSITSVQDAQVLHLFSRIKNTTYKFMVWNDGPINLPKIEGDCTAADVKWFIQLCSNVHRAIDSAVRGYNEACIQASIILLQWGCADGQKDQKTSANNNKAQDGQQETPPVEERDKYDKYRMYNALGETYRIMYPRSIGLSLLTQIMNPRIDSSEYLDEYSILMNCQPVRQLNLMTAIIGTNMNVAWGTVLNQFNLSGAAFNQALSQGGPPISILQNLSQSNESQLNLLTVYAMTVLDRCTILKPSHESFVARGWCQSAYFLTNLKIDKGNYFGQHFGHRIPYLINPLAVRGFWKLSPTLWGLPNAPISLNIRGEIEFYGLKGRRGWHISRGDREYANRSQSTSPYNYVEYGANVINIVRQWLCVNTSWEVNYDMLAAGERRFDTNANKFQPKYDEVLGFIEPGSLPTYDWGTRTVLAPWISVATIGLRNIDHMHSMNVTAQTDIGVSVSPYFSPDSSIFKNFPNVIFHPQ